MQKKSVVWVFILSLLFLPLGFLADNWLAAKGIYPHMYSGKINTIGTVIAFALALAVYLIVWKIRNRK